MFSLAYPLEDIASIDGVEYEIDMNFDTILRLIDMLGDKDLDDETQIETGLIMLLGVELDFSIEKKAEIFYELFDKKIAQGRKADQAVDIAGNPMPSAPDDEENIYSLVKDATYIYASFYQDYGIDLFDFQGKMHWNKFSALLGGLRENTKFKEVLSIRAMPLPTGKGSQKERERIKKLKEIYALKGQEPEFDDEED